MQRRKFLATTFTLGAVGLAGCSVFSDDNSDELESQIESQNQTIANLREENSELEEQVNDLEQEREQLRQESADFEQQISELEQDIEDTEGDVTQLENEKEQLIIDRLTTLYGSAEKFNDLAERQYSNAATAFENENYTRALNLFRAAWGGYDAVAELTFLTANLAQAEGYSNANSLAVESNSYTLNMRDACDSYSVAAQNYILGNIEAGDSNISTGDDAFNQAQRNEFTTSSMFENSIST